MQFLAPLFLAGAALVAIPLMLHLMRRRPKEKVAFSAVMFLRASPPRARRSRRMENILLLFLRCLIIGLLAFAFARPFLAKESLINPLARPGVRSVLLLDASASMRGKPWQESMKAARRVLTSSGPADEIAVVTFGQSTAPVVTFEEWNALAPGDRFASVAAKLDQIGPGWAASNIGGALTAAAEMLAEDGGSAASAKAHRIVLFSDLQKGGAFEEVQGFQWPRGMHVTVERVPHEFTSNASLQPFSGAARLRIANSPLSEAESFRLEWNEGGARDLHVSRGDSQAVPVPEGVEHVSLRGDDIAFDNEAWLVPRKQQSIRVSFQGDDRTDDPRGLLYYLQRAFQPMPTYRVELSVRAAKAEMVIISERLADPQPVKRHLSDGGAALLVLREGSGAETLAALTGVASISVREAADDDARLSEINFKDPVFASFADPRFGDFTKIHFWKHRIVDLAAVPGAETLARFEDGAPALFRVRVGKGQLLVLTSGWNPGDSQLALSSKFVPLMHAVLESSVAIRESSKPHFVGDVIPGTAGADIVKPDGKKVAVPTDATSFAETDQPGIYVVDGERVAVNIDPRESDLEPLSDEELTALGIPLSSAQVASVPSAAEQRKLASTELEQRQKLWRWLLLGAVVFLAMETVFAAVTTKTSAA